MEFDLPPHIQKTADGLYLSTRTSRYISPTKIGEICNKYWGNDMVIKDDRNKPVVVKNPTSEIKPEPKKVDPIVAKTEPEIVVHPIAYVRRKDGDIQSFFVNKITLNKKNNKVHLLLFDGKRIFRFKFNYSAFSIKLAYDSALSGIPMIGRIGTVVPKEYCKLHFSK